MPDLSQPGVALRKIVLVASPSDLLVEGETVSVVEAQKKPDGKPKEKPVAKL